MDVALLGATDYSVTELHDEWRQIDPHDRWVVLDGAELVGYGTVEQNPTHGQTDGYVHPDAFGRGVGTFLVAELERVLAERGVRRVQNATLMVDARAHELLRSQGYEEIRRFWHMRIELDAEPPARGLARRPDRRSLRASRRPGVPRGLRACVRRSLAAPARAVREVVAGERRPGRLLTCALVGRPRR